MAAVILIAVLFVSGAFGKIIISASRKNEAKTITDTKEGEYYNIFADGVLSDTDIAYLQGDGYDHKLDIHWPENASQPLPVIIDVHGGGLVGGEKELNNTQSQYFASYGNCVVINTNYTRLPDGTYATIIEDLYAVLYWMEQHQDLYPMDLERVYMTGDSGGGHIVSVMAAVQYDASLENWYRVEPASFRIRKFALTCPMVGTQELVHPKSIAYGFFSYLIGSRIRNDAEAMAKADIFTITDPALYPPVLLITTPEDKNFYPGAAALHEYWESVQVEHQYSVYKNETNQLEHVFNITHAEWEESRKANKEILSFFDIL